MKATDNFKTLIQNYLEKRAEQDDLFAVSYANIAKNIDDCVNYILNCVQKSGCNGFSDDEIYSMAVHYYDEDKIKVGKSINCKVVVNHTVELTEQEKEDARKKAIEQVTSEQIQKLKSKPKPKKMEANPLFEQKSLF